MTSYTNIEATDLYELIAKQKILFIDVRNDDEVAKGMIAGAKHVQLSLLPVQYEFLKTNLPIVFYCHSGVRSAHAAAFVSSKGATQVYNLIGGVIAWGRAGYPFVTKS